MTGLYLRLSQICDRMSSHRFLRPFYRFLFGIGLTRFVRHLFGLWFHINPTREMISEKEFFSEHAKELKAAYDSLEDDRSRIVFENILKYRATSDWTCLKKALGKDTKKTQYFVPELHFTDHEIIVNCGAFTGNTVKRFYKNIHGCSVIAFEPDEKNFESLQKLNYLNFKAIKAGVWSKDTTLRFSDESGGTPSGAVTTSGNAIIEVKALDNVPECQSATYIEMDVEGAELEALKGAEQMIKRREDRPKLAICIYHKPQDFFEIPLYIKKLNPDYKLFVHHHTPNFNETVLYAV